MISSLCRTHRETEQECAFEVKGGGTRVNVTGDRGHRTGFSATTRRQVVPVSNSSRLLLADAFDPTRPRQPACACYRECHAAFRPIMSWNSPIGISMASLQTTSADNKHQGKPIFAPAFDSTVLHNVLLLLPPLRRCPRLRGILFLLLRRRRGPLLGLL